MQSLRLFRRVSFEKTRTGESILHWSAMLPKQRQTVFRPISVNVVWTGFGHEETKANNPFWQNRFLDWPIDQRVVQTLHEHTLSPSFLLVSESWVWNRTDLNWAPETYSRIEVVWDLWLFGHWYAEVDVNTLLVIKFRNIVFRRGYGHCISCPDAHHYLECSWFVGGLYFLFFTLGKTFLPCWKRHRLPCSLYTFRCYFQ